MQKKPGNKLKPKNKYKPVPKKVKRASFNRKGGRRKKKSAKIAKEEPNEDKIAEEKPKEDKIAEEKPKEDKIAEEKPKESCFHGSYDLTAMGIPKDALPQADKPNKGAHSYTVVSSDNECAVEVLLRNRAFYSKRLATDAPGPRGQVGWATFHGIEAAWSEVKKRVGWADH